MRSLSEMKSLKSLPKIRGYAVIGLGLAIASLGFATSALADNPITGTVSMAFMAPIDITEKIRMNFGTVALRVNYDREVTMSPDGEVTVATSSGVTATGNVVAGEFEITGSKNQDISISIEGVSGPTLTVGNVNYTMEMTDFKHNAGANPALNDNGELTINVGVTLIIPALAANGIYTDGTYTVVANYS
ncbi:DUF4402 domain-containing protein [Sneathiella marina]|uniref:DUF4402 domain-containing protein n=1 Tax=Sneathiella marina TaxID=2950108 RepID=A0ABY4W103_9PROT|nr:DUF4402 domain-containing protein [Sneathiella marina]USG59753.1 DUF4402 domain-containing protein [Sneathiella marina]